MVINGRSRRFGSTKESAGIVWLFGVFFFIMAFSFAKFKSYFQRDGGKNMFVPLEEKYILLIMQ